MQPGDNHDVACRDQHSRLKQCFHNLIRQEPWATCTSTRRQRIRLDRSPGPRSSPRSTARRQRRNELRIHLLRCRQAQVVGLNNRGHVAGGREAERLLVGIAPGNPKDAVSLTGDTEHVTLKILQREYVRCLAVGMGPVEVIDQTVCVGLLR